MKYLAGVIAIGLPLVLFVVTPSRQKLLEIPAIDRSVVVDIADSNKTRRDGLSGRAALGLNEGMLFVFNSELTPSFWMKDMKFALDIIWIDQAGEIVGIEPDVSPKTFPETFSPDTPITHVLEVKAGRAEAWGLSVGDTVILPTDS